MAKAPRNRIKRHMARLLAADWQARHEIDKLPYPGILVRPEKGNRELVGEIVRILRDFRLDDPGCRGRLPPNNFKLLGKLGIHGLTDLMHAEAVKLGRSEEESETLAFHNATEPLATVGQWIFERIPQRFRAGHLSDHFFYVAFQDGMFEVRFDFLPEKQLPDGTAFSPPQNPRVTIDGRERPILLQNHAVDQIARRLRSTAQPTYADNATLYVTITHDLWDYVPVSLPNGQKALRLDSIVSKTPDRTWWHEVYVKQILGTDNLDHTAGNVMCVLGYLPLVEDDGPFWRAKTFLFPGYRNTPEHALIPSHQSSSELRHRLEAIAQDSNQHQVFFGQAAEALKWYHENGVPQVFQKP